MDILNGRISELEGELEDLKSKWDISSSGMVNKYNYIPYAAIEAYVEDKVTTQNDIVDTKEYNGIIMY